MAALKWNGYTSACSLTLSTKETWRKLRGSLSKHFLWFPPYCFSLHIDQYTLNPMCPLCVCRWRCVPRTKRWSGSWWSFTLASRSSSRSCPKRRMKWTRRAAAGTLRASEGVARGKRASPYPTWRCPLPFRLGLWIGGGSAGEAPCLENAKNKSSTVS